ncbi:MAG: hypothetical protein RLZZ400_83, partial [Actinomycetota bacterium]
MSKLGVFGKWTAFAATTALVAQLFQTLPASAVESDSKTSPKSPSSSAIIPAIKDVTIAPSAKWGTNVLEAKIVGAVGTSAKISWQRDGVDITGANATQYLVSVDDFGRNITATVRTQSAGFTDAVRVSNVYVPIAPSSDASLTSLTVNGIDASKANSVINVPSGTSKVSVRYVRSDEKAKVWVLGADNLHDGDNILRVVVVAENGESQTYTSTVRVASAANTDLAKFNIQVDGQTINGLDLGPSRVIFIPLGTKSVQTQIVTSDPDAIATVSGDTGLVDGSNTLVVRVLAANGVSSREYRVTLFASAEPTGIKRNALGDPFPSNDSSLASLAVDGTTITPGATITVANGTTSVAVTALATDAAATVDVNGDLNLVTGLNQVTVTVTAEDLTSTAYVFFVNVLESSDATLFEFSIEGVDITTDGQVVDVPSGTSAVDVFATPTDAAATVDVTGETGLTPGANTVTVTVTAEDGTVLTYTAVVNVLLSSDTSLFELSVDGVDVVAGGSVTVVSGTDVVDVVATPTYEFATVEVVGADGLTPGVNTIVVTVTAEDGSVASYSFTVVVELSSDTSLFSLSVDGVDVTAGSTINVANGTIAVDVLAEATYQFANVDVLGADDLSSGLNEIQIVVTAENGDVATYSIFVFVALSNDTSLSELSINGDDVVDGQVIHVAPGTTFLDVIATPTDITADVIEITGDQNLVAGAANTVTILVRAEDGTEQTYTLIIVVDLSSDTSLSEFTLNGT